MPKMLPQIDDRVLVDLEFPRIRNALAARAQTEAGKERCRTLPLLSTRDDVAETLALHGELIELGLEGEWPSLGNVRPIEEPLRLAERGGVLEPLRLMEIAGTLASGERAANWCVARREQAPRVAALMDAFGEYADVVRAIDRSFEPSGRISDDASATMGDLRRKAAALADTLSTRMEALVKDLDAQGLLQDRYHTQREGRFVVPVKHNERWRVTGIVHDTSQTSQTFFIEPQEVVDLGNRLKSATSDVQEEELRILKALSAKVGARAAEIAEDLKALHELDVAVAVARLGVELKCSVPRLAPPGGTLHIRAFRHPLLLLEAADRSTVVANDLMVGQPAVLVITGPNTGGKTVALKGVGLSTLMVRAGLPIPAAPESDVPLYDHVFSVIGDLQSIEQGLSSFGGHVMAVRRMVDGVRKGTAEGGSCLCVLDEVMAGTDPDQGAALAQALLESLAASGAQVVATTHFERLKALGLDEQARQMFRNASVGLHATTHAPTYRLSYDAPGSSSAMDMAAQLGLGIDIIERARVLASEQGRNLEALLKNLSLRQAALEDELRKLSDERERLEHARTEAESRARSLRDRERTLKREAREGLLMEIRHMRRQLEEEMDKARTALQRASSGDGAAAAIKEAQAALGRVSAMAENLAERQQQERRAEALQRGKPAELKAGARVFVISLGVEGEIVELGARDALIAAGAMRVRVPTKDLAAAEAVSRPHVVESAPRRPADRRDPDAIPRTLDLRGERAEDALEHLTAFLDRAYGVDAGPFTVIHGHGTGALRKAIRAALKESPYVAAFQKGPEDQGGDGVTVVTLKEG
ncbi:MAG: Smr/MutS family protein [Myxococcota bacterium]